ncbi:asparagine synthase (glutamine-hydrolyzing) [Candidatus Pelagibacter sp.]|nr:asparagine synthase (glutamine-hydrolyzing) [Candidatus Pelagibacter sp.]
MCGICGFFSKSSLTFNDAIVKMNSAISHRGPDANGVWQDLNSGIVLGHQRLSIIDLSVAGHQPMQSNSSRFVLTYNGEIYNHLDIRRELKSIDSKIKWRGSSDTETLLEAIELWGVEKTLKKIAGMFAFGLWDKKNRSLTLARDRMGEKPLYFGWQGKGDNKVFLFGSELKALKVHPEFNGEINRDSIALQFAHSYIPAPHSIYKDINKLLPGYYLQLKEKDLKECLVPDSKPYWSMLNTAISGSNNTLSISTEKVKNELEKLLQNTIKQQMISDVPLGAFLSGGVDSSVIVALMQKQSPNPIKTFTIGFNEHNYNEANYAKEVAQHLGTDHTEFYISGKKAMEVIPKLSYIYDEPFSDSSQIPTFLLSKLAKQKVTVSLSGDGGDELFCGYNRYTMSKNWWNKVCLIPFSVRKFLSNQITSLSPKNWNKLFNFFKNSNYPVNYGELMYKFARVLNCKSLDEVYLKLTSHFENPNDVVLNSKFQGNFLRDYKTELKEFDDQQKMMIYDGLSYLPNDILVKVDRASMAASLETRAPFLDHRIVEYLWKIPQALKLRNGQSKWILRKILYQYVPKKLIERPKIGFGVPINTWLRGPLKDWAESLLNKTRLQKEGYLNPELIYTKWTEHQSEKKDWQYHLWNVLMFQLWLDTNKK